MSESTPVFEPPVDNATSAVEIEGSGPTATATDNGGSKENNNSQDVTMAGLEGSGVKAAKTGAVAEPALASNNNNNNNTAATTTASSSTNPPTPNRTSTPTGSKETVSARLENNSSRAASAAPADRTADRVTMPTEPAAHGAPTRQYLNSKVTYHVMEGMKIIAKEQPADPLRVLGEFLLQRSAELEHAGTASSGRAEGEKEKIADNGADTSIAEL